MLGNGLSNQGYYGLREGKQWGMCERTNQLPLLRKACRSGMNNRCRARDLRHPMSTSKNEDQDLEVMSSQEQSKTENDVSKLINQYKLVQEKLSRIAGKVATLKG